MNSTEGIICEGFARSIDQAELFDEALTWLGRKYLVFNLDVSEEEAMRRQLGRHKIDARPDTDSPEKLKKRFEEYTQHTEPVLKFFKEKGVLAEINGEQAPDQIAAELYSKLQNLAWVNHFS
jgi:adenylate kinase